MHSYGMPGYGVTPFLPSDASLRDARFRHWMWHYFVANSWPTIAQLAIMGFAFDDDATTRSHWAVRLLRATLRYGFAWGSVSPAGARCEASPPPAPLSTKVAEGGGEILRGLVWCRSQGVSVEEHGTVAIWRARALRVSLIRIPAVCTNVLVYVRTARRAPWCRQPYGIRRVCLAAKDPHPNHSLNCPLVPGCLGRLVTGRSVRGSIEVPC